jgi:hypothetical protein
MEVGVSGGGSSPGGSSSGGTVDISSDESINVFKASTTSFRLSHGNTTELSSGEVISSEDIDDGLVLKNILIDSYGHIVGVETEEETDVQNVVNKIIAGNNITISSSKGDGTGEVTINAIGGNSGSATFPSVGYYDTSISAGMVWDDNIMPDGSILINRPSTPNSDAVLLGCSLIVSGNSSSSWTEPIILNHYTVLNGGMWGCHIMTAYSTFTTPEACTLRWYYSYTVTATINIGGAINEGTGISLSGSGSTSSPLVISLNIVHQTLVNNNKTNSSASSSGSLGYIALPYYDITTGLALSDMNGNQARHQVKYLTFYYKDYYFTDDVIGGSSTNNPNALCLNKRRTHWRIDSSNVLVNPVPACVWTKIGSISIFYNSTSASTRRIFGEMITGLNSTFYSLVNGQAQLSYRYTSNTVIDVYLYFYSPGTNTDIVIGDATSSNASCYFEGFVEY